MPNEFRASLRLFDDPQDAGQKRESLGPGAVVLRGFATKHSASLLNAVADAAATAPFRHQVTPGGFRMSVAMTNCGAFGWITDESGYRYVAEDPLSGDPWPPMPACFCRLANDAAAEAGFDGFEADACLINRYEPGARMTLHQDHDERDLSAPIVSVSLGVPAMFLFGGLKRSDRQRRIPLCHGDVVVWGGPARLRYHGVLPLKEDRHPALGARRINLTFRKAR
jgi:alkylated DNA repair protein (DNA oxidative demethylase)